MAELELAAIGEALGMSYRGVHKRAATQQWPYTTRPVRGGQQRLYPIATLPPAVRDAVLAHQARQAMEQASQPSALLRPTVPKVDLGRGQPMEAAPAPAPRLHIDLAAALAGGRAAGDAGDVRSARADEAARRLAAITPILQWPAGKKGKKAFVQQHARSIGESIATLYRWIAAYNAGGAAALMRKTRSDANQARQLISPQWQASALMAGIDAAQQVRIAEDLQRAVRGLWAQQGLGSVAQIQRLAWAHLVRLSVAAGMDEETAAQIALVPRRFVEAERRFALIALHDRDAKGFYDRAIPAVTRSRASLQPADVVFGDVSPSDIPVLRPDGTLGWARFIAWQDAATNALFITGHLADKGSGVRREHIALSFAQMCEQAPWGLPKRLYLDNGSEYKWAHMLDAWAQLAQFSGGAFGGAFGMGADEGTAADGSVHLGGVGRIIRSTPFKPRGKSIEGQFGNLLRFMSWHPAFAGSDRLRKKTASLGVGPCATSVEDLRQMLADALGFYHATAQTGHLQGQSPAEAMAAHLSAGFTPVRVDAEVFALAFAETLVRRVTAGTVRIDGVSYYSEQLHAYNGEKLDIRWARHMPDVCWAFGPRGELIATAAAAPVFEFTDLAGAKHAARLAQQARQAVTVLRGQVGWLDPRELMGEFARLKGADRVADMAAARARRVELSGDAQAMLAARHAAAQAAAEQAQGVRAGRALLERWAVEESPEEAAARLLLADGSDGDEHGDAHEGGRP